MREPHDFTIECCCVCGAQLDRSGNGRCPVSRDHWKSGGMVVRVLARPAAEQGKHFRRGVIPLAAIAPDDKEGSHA
jgi:hypothetical protein